MTGSPAPTTTIVALVQNRPGVLNRITGLLRRRQFDLHALSMGRSETPGRSRLTLTVGGDAAYARRVASNLEKIVEVLHVEPLADRSAVRRDLALIQVAPERDALAEINALCAAFRARIVDVSPGSIIVEITGEGAKIEGFRKLLEPFRIVALARSECVALPRGRLRGETADVPDAAGGEDAATSRPVPRPVSGAPDRAAAPPRELEESLP